LTLNKMSNSIEYKGYEQYLKQPGEIEEFYTITVTRDGKRNEGYMYNNSSQIMRALGGNKASIPRDPKPYVGVL